MTSDPLEQRLSTALKSLSAWAIVETTFAPRDFAAYSSAAPLSDEPTASLGSSDVMEPSGARNRHRGRFGVRRVSAAVALAVGVGGAGAGITAATGLFSTTVGTRLIAPARGQVAPTGHWTAAHVITRVSEPGPDGSTITLQTSSSERYNGCVHLEATGPTETTRGTVVCGQVFNGASPPTTSTPSTSYFPSGQWPWSTPAGQSFMILYGKAPSGTVTAKLVKGFTGAVVVSDIPLSSGFYLYPIPTSSSAGGKVEFFSETGNELGTSPG